MPQARKPSPARRPSAFKEPAALKRLNRSLETAQAALAELGKQGGRDVGAGARDLQKDLRTFLTSARGHGKKLGKALQRDFEQAQKNLTGSRAPARKPSSSPGRKKTAGGATKRSASRSTRKRS